MPVTVPIVCAHPSTRLIMPAMDIVRSERNNTICGLSRAMVLIEARTTGERIQAGRDCMVSFRPLIGQS